MSRQSKRAEFLGGGISAFLRDRSGNVALLSALLLPVILGGFGLGAEVSTWQQNQRVMQNAADAAAVAAATNAGASYNLEAKAVASQYGFQDGVGGVHVSASNAATCPGGGATCYSVIITKAVPLLLAQLVGYQGDTVVAGSAAKLVSATAIAVQDTTPRPYCLLALAGSGAQGIRTNGAPKANMAGCNLMSNSDATCNGHNLGADIGDAFGTNNGCGVVANSNIPKAPDPYAGLVAKIPSNPCSTYPQEPSGKKGTPLPTSNQLSGAQNWGGTTVLCGDVQLTGDVTVNASAPGAVLVIENGQLDTNGYALKTNLGSALTIIFSGTNDPTYQHVPSGGGTLDIQAPSSGDWSGVAIYQDPRLTSGVDISAAGNSPTWDITGLVYLPHASVTFSGAVNKSSNGKSCFGLVVDNVLINGTGGILAQGECGAAGLSLPSGNLPDRGKLVS